VIDWTTAGNAELAVLWYALHYDDGLYYDSDTTVNSVEGRLIRAVDAEAEHRGLTAPMLKRLAHV
jgi:hypothetical protein